MDTDYREEFDQKRGIAGSQVIGGLCTSILPRDKEPLMLSTLSKEQKKVIEFCLNVLAFVDTPHG